MDDARSVSKMFELTYDDLRRIARRQRLVGRSTEMTQAAALVHETYLRFRRRLHSLSAERLANRQAFVRIVTMMMRSVAIDRWRMRRAGRRGADHLRSARTDDLPEPGANQLDSAMLLTLDDALTRLRAAHPEWFEVVAQRYFAGRTFRETASALGIDVDEVRSRRRRALEWLRCALRP